VWIMSKLIAIIIITIVVVAICWFLLSSTSNAPSENLSKDTQTSTLDFGIDMQGKFILMIAALFVGAVLVAGVLIFVK